ncbi:MAG: hypothetical protein IJ210_15185 [Clostridia bacterium]|nr:hypothetical protein [Clostridia bacterium]
MADRNMVIKSIENCLHNKKCDDCSYEGCIHAHGSCIGDLMAHALELLKNEPNAPAKNMTYYRLMEIKNELETENENLKADVKELRRLTGSLTNLCENLLKRIAADDRT